MEHLVVPPPTKGSRLTRYAVAVGVSGIAILVTAWLGSFLEPMRFFFFWVAVLVSALIGGTGPAILATVISTLAVIHFVFEPVSSFGVADPADVVRIVMFSAFALAIGWAIALRKREEERAQQLRRWLATTLASIGDAVIAANADGKVVFVNREAARLIGLEPASAIGLPVEELFFLEGQGAARLENPVQIVLRENRIVETTGHTLLVRRDGERVPVEDSAAPIRADNGGMIGVVVVFRDVTAKRASERVIRRSEARYRNLVTAAPAAQAVWILDASGKMLEDSPTWRSFTGQSAEALMAGGWIDAVHPDDREAVHAAWQKARAATAPFETEYRARMTDGTYRWFSARGAPLLDDEGSIIEWVGTAIDIDEQKRASDEIRFINEASALLASSLDYQTTLATVSRLVVPRFADWCAVDIATDEGTYERLSVAHVDPRKVALAYELNQRYPPDPATDPVLQAIRTGEKVLIPQITDEMILAGARDPEHLEVIRSLGLSSFLLLPMTARGRTLGTITFALAESGRFYSERDLPLLEDLARRGAIAVDNARLYQEAESANRAKDEFLATLSHELRTPLTAILGWARMLRTGSTDPKTQELAFETIERSAKAQAELIDEILDISRIVTGKFELAVAPVDLLQLTKQILDSFHPAAEAKQIRLELESSTPKIAMRGDPARLKQVIWNLVSNALKFSDPGATVLVRLERSDARVRLSVHDTGRGIDPEFLPHVWERFRQADSTTTRQFGGLGLGLSVVRHLVELHGGSVEVTSEGLGRGATFTVEFPVQTDDVAEPVVKPVRPDAAGALAGRTMLVVDDDDDARHLIGTILRSAGATVDTANSVKTAMARIERDGLDAVVTDIAMPVEDGYSLVRQVRAAGQTNTSRLPVIALSALGRDVDRQRMRAAGFDDFLLKPVDPPHLVAAVAAAVGRKDSPRKGF
jgi:PAS domain S-box-containing protein